MICKKCGYDYPAKELKCPYCGEVNPLGEKWKSEENLARKETLPPAQMPGCAGG